MRGWFTLGACLIWTLPAAGCSGLPVLRRPLKGRRQKACGRMHATHRSVSDGSALLPPQSAGIDPSRSFLEMSSRARAPKRPEEPHSGGSSPSSSLDSSSKFCSTPKPPLSPHAAGRLPARVAASKDCEKSPLCDYYRHSNASSPAGWLLEAGSERAKPPLLTIAPSRLRLWLARQQHWTLRAALGQMHGKCSI